MSKALKHYIVYSGSSGWWHSENLSVQEWVNKIDHNMNSLCQLRRGAYIRYSANLVVCAKVGGSGAIPPMLSNSTSPQILIDTVKGVTVHKHCHFPCTWQGKRKHQIQKWDLGDAPQTASGGRNLTVQNTGCSWPREWLDGSVVGRTAVKKSSRSTPSIRRGSRGRQCLIMTWRARRRGTECYEWTLWLWQWKEGGKS